MPRVGIHDVASIEKHPGAVLDYAIDWSLWLGSDVIATFNISVPTGLTLDSSTNTQNTVTFWLSGGTANADYVLVVTITTAAGKTESKSIKVMVRAKGAA